MATFLGYKSVKIGNVFFPIKLFNIESTSDAVLYTDSALGTIVDFQLLVSRVNDVTSEFFAQSGSTVQLTDDYYCRSNSDMYSSSVYITNSPTSQTNLMYLGNTNNFSDWSIIVPVLAVINNDFSTYYYGIVDLRDLTNNPGYAYDPPATGYIGRIQFTPSYTVRVTYWTTSTASNNALQAILTDYNPDSDPFIPGGENEHGGGGGDFSDPSEDVTDPAVPDISAVDTGFITLFNPSVSQLNSLASYMWSAGFDLDTFKKMFANPMDCILGLSILPKIVPSGGSRTVMVGNISTGVSMTVAASQYVKFDCGSVNVKRYSNSFLDYAPYTKVSIYLPFIGIHELSVDDVMNKSVHVKYNIDILSGACVAFVICGGTTLYTYTGQCAASVPVTSGDWSNMINGVIGAVGGALKAAVGGAAMGGLVGAVGAGAASLASSAMDVAGMKPSVEHSGNMGGMGGMMGVKTPFLIITRPQQAIPAQQNKYTGYPAFMTKSLNALEGYTEIEEIHLENIPATEQELTEIYNLLKSGVIM